MSYENLNYPFSETEDDIQPLELSKTDAHAITTSPPLKKSIQHRSTSFNSPTLDLQLSFKSNSGYENRTNAFDSPATNSEVIPDEYDSDFVMDVDHTAWAFKALALESVIKCGYLKKKGEKRKTWKKRWFVLKPTKLAYYKNEKEYELLHYIDLEHITVAAPVKTKKGNMFGLVTKVRTYYIQARTEEIMREWVYEIRNALKSLKHTSDESLRHSNVETGVEATKDLTVDTNEKMNSGSLQDTAVIFTAASETSTKAGMVRNTSGTFDSPNYESSIILQSRLNSGSTPSTRFALPRISTVTENGNILSVHTSIEMSPRFMIPQSNTHTHSRILENRLQNGQLFSSPGQESTSYEARSLPLSQRNASSPHPPTLNLLYNSKGERPSSYSKMVTFADFDGSSAQVPSPFSPTESYTTDALISSGEEDLVEDLMLNQGTDLLNNSRIVHQGFLEKKAKMNRAWKVRWFVLRNNRLTCYKDEKEYETKRLIDMRNVLDVIEVDPLGKTHIYCFKVILHKRSLILCADSEQSRKEWIELLKTVHEEINGSI